MHLAAATAVARAWVGDAGARMPGFAGAFLHGSAVGRAGGDVLAPTSDLDVIVVLETAEVPGKVGKIRVDGVLLDVSYLAAAEIRTPEDVLGVSHLAGSLRAPSVLADPSGRLTALQAAVTRDFAQRRWVRARVAHVEGKVHRYLDTLDALDFAAPLATQVISWLFGTSVTTHLLLVAGLRNPTVRRRYLDARTLLADYGQAAIYPDLLALLGCATWTPAQAEAHLAALTAVYDATSPRVRTPVFFASDLSAESRPIAIDGSRALIARGDHREAVFWIAVTYSRCLDVLARDAPALVEGFLPGYRRLLADLGIGGPGDLRRRGGAVRAFLPRLRGVAEAIMAANPEIRDEGGA